MHALDRPPEDTTAPSSFSPHGVVLAGMVAASVSIVVVVPAIVLTRRSGEGPT